MASVTFNNFDYKGDKYDIAKDIAKKEREYHASKVQEKPFSNKVSKTEYFNTPL